MYGGFKLNLRPIPQIIDEVLAIKKRWPLSTIYFQDDVFGFNLDWLAAFVREWKEKVGVPWHCQIRLELTRDERRLDLFREGGCTGITLAIESGNDFLRRFVLLREMPDGLIIEGIAKIKDRGFMLRTEQILAVPFSDIETDLQTLELNVRLNPEIAWTSILSPFGGTQMGTIATKYGFYHGNNDDLDEAFFHRSVLCHTAGGPALIEPFIRSLVQSEHQNPLIDGIVTEKLSGQSLLLCKKNSNRLVSLGSESSTTIRHLDQASNDLYCDQTVILQRIFNWLAKLPDGHKLAATFVNLPKDERTWGKLGCLAKRHLETSGYGDKVLEWEIELSRSMGYSGHDQLPAPIAANPHYFTFMPSGNRLAKKVLDAGILSELTLDELFRRLGEETRRWLYSHLLYGVKQADAPIAKR